MNFTRRFVPLAVLTLAAMLSFSGCKKTTTAQDESQNAQSAQNPGQASAGQPSGPSGPSGAERYSGPDRRQRSAGPQAPSQPPPPAVLDLPSGTNIRVRLDQDLGSKISQAGDSFTATVSDDIIVNGQTVIPKGARADGTVIDARPLGRFKGGASLSVRLERVTTNWGSYPVATSTLQKAEQGKGKRSAEFIGGGAGIGALIGGLAGGGKGALIGGLLGAGGGTAGSAFTGNKQILLPAETLLTFTLDHSVHITEQNQPNQPNPQNP